MLEPACRDLVVVRDLEMSGQCIRTREATSAGRPVLRHSAQGPVLVNGMLLTPPKGGYVTLTAPRGDTSLLARPPRLQAQYATVKLPVEGTIATIAKGRLDWTLVDHDLRGFELRDDGLQVNGLRVTGMPHVPKVKAGRGARRRPPRPAGGVRWRDLGHARAAERGRCERGRGRTTLLRGAERGHRTDRARARSR